MKKTCYRNVFYRKPHIIKYQKINHLGVHFIISIQTTHSYCNEVLKPFSHSLLFNKYVI
jgi:hypothetical protein